MMQSKKKRMQHLTRRNEARATPSENVRAYYQRNRMFLWMFSSYIDSC